jgi:hypothetical protein
VKAATKIQLSLPYTTTKITKMICRTFYFFRCGLKDNTFLKESGVIVAIHLFLEIYF